jgi:hypothetical protein
MNTQTVDVKSVRKEFQALLSSDITLKAIGEPTDKYYADREVFTKKLETFIRTRDMSVLTTNQLLHICRMVGTYRPMALHTFFIYCSELIKD